MAVKSSGSLSFQTDIVGEFDGTAPHSLSEYYDAGTGIPASGAISFSDFYGTEAPASDITITLSNTTNVITSSTFGSTDWASTTPKILNIPSGVTVGSTSSGAALTVSSGMGGTLTINNYGSIIGKGGAGSSSGNGEQGRHAITNLQSSGITIINHSGGIIAGGGGGGGKGGNGGQGRVVSSGRDPASGQYYDYGSGNNYYWRSYASNGWYITAKWNGSTLSGIPNGSTSRNVGGGTIYYKGTLQLTEGVWGNYGIYKTYSSTTYYSGGTGGAGGNGRGYNQNQSNGTAGTNGSNGAGNGGAGGNGGAYGADGSTGTSGTTGNWTGGSAGGSGGAAGDAISGATPATYTNNGSVYGDVA